jgi:hypothetical protein
MGYGIGKYGEGVYGQLTSAITESEIIPPDAKRALKNYLRDTFRDLWSSLEDILYIDPPAEVLEHWDKLLDLVRYLISG